MQANYFADCASLEEVRKKYRQLAIQHHPDKGGDVETMKAINAEHDWITRHFTATGNNPRTGQAFTAEETEAEILASEQYAAAVQAVAALDGLTLELVGAWLWATGDTYPHRATLKGAGFMWASQKKAWYFRTEEHRSSNRSKMDLDEIRARHGSVNVKANKRPTLKK